MKHALLKVLNYSLPIMEIVRELRSFELCWWRWRWKEMSYLVECNSYRYCTKAQGTL